MRIYFTLGIATMLSVVALSATITLKAQTVTNKAALDRAATLLRQYETNQYAKAMALAARYHWPLTIHGKHGKLAMLSGVDRYGMPIYKVTFNLESAQTTRTNTLWPGGSTNLSLSGNSANMKGKLAIWDGGAVLATHVELAGRVFQKDSATDVIDHATHTSGTMIATGINPQAKGMAYQAQELDAYDWNNDLTEMATAAPNLYLSNASYGIIAGWNLNSDNNHWEWWGTAGDTTDYKFGWYSNDVQARDSIMYNAPYYLLSQAAGNSRGETGPPVDSPYYQVNAQGNEASTSTKRSATLSSNALYNTIPPYGTSKNAIVVGAIEPIPSGYSSPSDVQMTYFSGWGPTGDGRIKPDVVADGDNVLSTISTNNYAYEEESGTSMATPNVTGSLFLLQEYYTKLHHDSAMLASTLKALAIHTADESGANPGPDYQSGWGLLDTRAAAATITASHTDQSQLIIEKVMSNSGANDTISIPVVASGKGPLVATIAWTDPAGPLNTSSNQHNYPVELVNDLDLRVIKGTSIYGTTVYAPWVLNPANPNAAATRGDDKLNNVEKVEADTVTPGGNYIIRITHKGTLARGQQAVSVIIGGVGGTGYCASAPASSAGTMIDSVSVGGMQYRNSALNCTTYTDNTGLRVNLTGGQTAPVLVSMASCTSTAATRVVKVYIDYNGNGSFSDPGEEVANSGVLTSAVKSNLIASFTVPSNVTVGNTTRMRIVAVETNDTNQVTPCGSYGNGETQDYSVYFNQPSVDLSLTSLSDPLSPICADTTQIVTVNIRNMGTTTQSNIPVVAKVMNGSTPVVTLTGTYPDAIAAGSGVVYTLPGTFNAQAGSTYTIVASANLGGDQNTSNDTATFSINVNAAPANASSGTALVCSGSATTLKVNNPDSSSSYFWYTTPTGGLPVAQGYNTTTTSNATTFYFSSGFSGGTGPLSKATLDTAGGYNAFYGNWVSYHAAVPVTLESARFYTKYHGNIAFIVADVDQSSITSSGSYQYLPYSTTTLYVNATSPHPEKPHSDGSTQTSDPADTGAVFFLNMQLPAGDHDIIIESLDSATIYRNAGIPGSPYPIGSTNGFAWTGNSAGVTSTSLGSTFQGYYYFFYDAKIKTADCASSGARTQVNASTATAGSPTITEIGDSLLSSAGSGNQWYLNGLALAGATDSVYIPKKSGTYYTIVSGLSGGCSAESNSINYVLTAVDTAAAPKGLLVTPNPTTGLLNVSFTVTNTADLTFEVYNILGQLLYKQAYPAYIGSYSGQLNLSGYADGVYLLKITHGDNTTIEKILLQH